MDEIELHTYCSGMMLGDYESKFSGQYGMRECRKYRTMLFEFICFVLWTTPRSPLNPSDAYMDT